VQRGICFIAGAANSRFLVAELLGMTTLGADGNRIRGLLPEAGLSY
jgi:hypothetical protein